MLLGEIQKEAGGNNNLLYSIGADWRARFDGSPQAADLDRFTQHLLSAHMPHAVIVDCSASPEVADRYAEWLAAGIHVITPNKQAGAGPLPRYQTALFQACFFQLRFQRPQLGFEPFAGAARRCPRNLQIGDNTVVLFLAQ